MPDIPQFDKSKFKNDPYVKRVEKPWGYELHWVPEGMPYMGKLMHINKGHRLSLQIHDTKQESYWLSSGECNLVVEDQNGDMQKIPMQKGFGYTMVVGQKHRHEAVTDCDVIEASTPEAGTTWRLEDDYNRPDETPQQRKIERGEK